MEKFFGTAHNRPHEGVMRLLPKYWLAKDLGISAMAFPAAAAAQIPICGEDRAAANCRRPSIHATLPRGNDVFRDNRERPSSDGRR